MLHTKRSDRDPRVEGVLEVVVLLRAHAVSSDALVAEASAQVPIRPSLPAEMHKVLHDVATAKQHFPQNP